MRSGARRPEDDGGVVGGGRRLGAGMDAPTGGRRVRWGRHGATGAAASMTGSARRL